MLMFGLNFYTTRHTSPQKRGAWPYFIYRFAFFLIFALSCSGALKAQITVINKGILHVDTNQLMHIGGHFINQSSDLQNRGVMQLTNDFTNEAPVYNQGVGLFRFNGTERQTVYMYSPLEMHNMEVFDTAGVTLLGDFHLEIFNEVNFREGVVYTNRDNYLSFQPGSRHRNVSTSSHVQGPARKIGDENFVFPIGREGELGLMAILDVDSPSEFVGEYWNEGFFTQEVDTTLEQVSDQEYWRILRPEGTADPRISLSNDGYFDGADLAIAYFNDLLWTRIDAERNLTETLPNSLLSINEITRMGYYTIAVEEYEVVDLIQIEVVQDENCDNLVTWLMPPNYIVFNYEVQVSTDSSNFTTIASVQGSPDVLQEFTEFEYLDENFYEAEVLYYRIKLITPTGLDTYSPVARLENDCIFRDCDIFPNPVSTNNNLKIRISSEAEKDLVVAVYDVPGRMIFQQTIPVEEGYGEYEIFTSRFNLPAATYFLTVGPNKVLKFVVTF